MNHSHDGTNTHLNYEADSSFVEDDDDHNSQFLSNGQTASAANAGDQNMEQSDETKFEWDSPEGWDAIPNDGQILDIKRTVANFAVGSDGQSAAAASAAGPEIPPQIIEPVGGDYLEIMHHRWLKASEPIMCSNDTIAQFFKTITSDGINPLDTIDTKLPNFYQLLCIVFAYLPERDEYGNIIFSRRMSCCREPNQNELAVADIKITGDAALKRIENLIKLLNPRTIVNDDKPDDILYDLVYKYISLSMDANKEYILCIYNYFKDVLNEYLNLLITFNILFNAPLKTHINENMGDYKPVAAVVMQEDEQLLPPAAASQVQPFVPEPRLNSASAHSLYNLQKLLMKTTEDRLYYHMNSSLNAYISEVNTRQNERILIDIMLKLAPLTETGAFKKLYYVLLTYLNSGFSFKRLQQIIPVYYPQASNYDFESFFYTYSIFSYVYPVSINEIDNVLFLQSKGVELDQNYTVFKIIDVLQNILINQVTKILFLILELNFNLLIANLDYLCNNLHELNQENRPPDKARVDMLNSSNKPGAGNGADDSAVDSDGETTGESQSDSEELPTRKDKAALKLANVQNLQIMRNKYNSVIEAVPAAAATKRQAAAEQATPPLPPPGASASLAVLPPLPPVQELPLIGDERGTVPGLRENSTKRTAAQGAIIERDNTKKVAAEAAEKRAAEKRTAEARTAEEIKKTKNGGQVGGDCNSFTPEFQIDAERLKNHTEYGHDLKSTRGRGSVLGGENIFGVSPLNGGQSQDIYALVDGVFKNIVQRIPVGSYNDGNQKMEQKFITDYRNAIDHMDEPMYLSTVIDAIALHCSERLDDFFYNPIVGFVLKDLQNNKILYDLLNAKIELFYPFDYWNLFMRTKEEPIGKTNLYLSVVKKTPAPQAAQQAAAPPADAQGNNNTLKFYQQDMGIGNSLDMTFQEHAYIAAYNAAFNPPSDNNIDNFFSIAHPTYVLKPGYSDPINAATPELTSGTIILDTLVNAVNDQIPRKIKITGSIWVIDVLKLTDPANTSKPPYGNIFTINNGRIEKIFIGYPNTSPLNQNNVALAGDNSQTVFNNVVDAMYPQATDDEIKTFLKELNRQSVAATIEAINLLLRVWIVNPDITSYQFILDNNRNVTGFKFSNAAALAGAGADAFTYTLYVGDLAVTNICYAMIAHFKTRDQDKTLNVQYGSQQELLTKKYPLQKSIIEQMYNIQTHDGYNYDQDRDGHDDNARVSYELAIIASFKSFGDEGQRIASEKLGDFLSTVQNLSEDSKHMWLLSSDRPLIAQGLLNNQPVIADLKIPHEKFGIIQEIPFGKIDGITIENGGILSNRIKFISKSKSTLELLNEARTELTEIKNMLDAKLDAGWNDNLGPAPAAAPAANGSMDEVDDVSLSAAPADVQQAAPDKSMDNDDGVSSSAVNAADVQAAADVPQAAADVPQDAAQAADADNFSYDYWNTILKAAIDALALAQQQQQDIIQLEQLHKSTLTRVKKFISIMKQLFIGLEYYMYQFDIADLREKRKKYIKYIDSQIDHAISMSIDTKTYQDLVAFNSGDGIHTRDGILKAFRIMYNSIEFGPKLFDCYGIACKEFQKKIGLYIDIINTSSILNSDTKEVIVAVYSDIIVGVDVLYEKFVEDVKTNLESKINKKELPRESKIIERGHVTKLDELQKQETEAREELDKIRDTKKRLDTEKQDTDKKITEAETNKSSASKKEKSFFTQTTATLKSALKSLSNIIKGQDAQEKKYIEEQTKLQQQIQKEMQKELAAKSIRMKDKGPVLDFFRHVINKWGEFTSSSRARKAKNDAASASASSSGIIGNRLGSGGNRTRKNNQKYYKQYTKRQKKIYRRRSQRNLKHKRHKHTRRH